MMDKRLRTPSMYRRHPCFSPHPEPLHFLWTRKAHGVLDISAWRSRRRIKPAMSRHNVDPLSSPSLAVPTDVPPQSAATLPFSVCSSGQNSQHRPWHVSFFLLSASSSSATSDIHKASWILFALLHPGPWQHHLLPGLWS